MAILHAYIYIYITRHAAPVKLHVVIEYLPNVSNQPPQVRPGVARKLHCGMHVAATVTKIFPVGNHRSLFMVVDPAQNDIDGSAASVREPNERYNKIMSILHERHLGG